MSLSATNKVSIFKTYTELTYGYKEPSAVFNEVDYRTLFEGQVEKNYVTINNKRFKAVKDNTSSIKLNHGEIYVYESTNEKTFAVVEKNIPCENTQSFKDFLTEKGIIGIYDGELEDSLTPIFAKYGPLKEIAQFKEIKAEKGVLLYGPPGNGKTLFARALADFLAQDKGKIKKVSATELIGSLVGNTEKAIRDLFEPARQSFIENGVTPLHIVIIDEIDSICMSRSSRKNAWEVTQVNQLLTCMDGLDQLDNLLVIGMTNNFDVIDEALLRPGRFGTKINIKLPDQNNREQILRHYTKGLVDKKQISLDVDFVNLAKDMDGFSGADLSGTIEKAKQIAWKRLINGYESHEIKHEHLKNHIRGVITSDDFQAAMKRIKS